MTNTITVEIHDVDTEPLISFSGLALLFGVDIPAIEALPIKDGVLTIPPEWARRGKQRSNEAQAHTGSDFVLDLMQYWARKDHGVDIEVVYR